MSPPAGFEAQMDCAANTTAVGWGILATHDRWLVAGSISATRPV